MANSIISKLKTSATLWGVIAGLVTGIATIMNADENVAQSVSGAIIAVVPLVVYIYSKFKLRIAMADANNDGKISAQELMDTIIGIIGDTKEQTNQVIEILADVAGSVKDSAEKEVPQEEAEIPNN